MPFTEQELELLAQSCYGDPRLPHWLERMLEEGPGEDGWPEGERDSKDKPVPIDFLVWNEIFHQGTLYPATFVAIPILCRAIEKFDNSNHSRLINSISTVENFRRIRGLDDEPYEADLPEEVLRTYYQSLGRLAEAIPRHLKLINPEYRDYNDVRSLLSSLAILSGHYIAYWMISGAHLMDSGGNINPLLMRYEELIGNDEISRSLRLDFVTRQQWRQNQRNLREIKKDSLL